MQAFAASLDVTLLASPTGVEAFVPLIGREGAELREFILGKEAASDVLPVVDGADELDVDTEPAVGGEGEEREAARVRDIEVDGRVAGDGDWGRLGKSGFAAFGVMELNLAGRSGEILAEEFTENGTGGDVGIAIAMEGEPVGASVLVGGQDRFPRDRRQALGIVGQPPDLDFAWGKPWEGVRRAQPVGRGRHGGILCQVGVGWVNGQ